MKLRIKNIAITSLFQGRVRTPIFKIRKISAFKSVMKLLYIVTTHRTTEGLSNKQCTTLRLTYKNSQQISLEWIYALCSVTVKCTLPPQTHPDLHAR